MKTRLQGAVARLKTKAVELYDDPKILLTMLLIMTSTAVSFLWNAFTAETWQEAVVMGAVALVSVVLGGRLLATVERYFEAPEVEVIEVDGDRVVFMVTIGGKLVKDPLSMDLDKGDGQ